VSIQVLELAEKIKEKGRRSALELPPLLEQAERFAADPTLDSLTRALAHRAAGNALQLLNRFETALEHYNHAVTILETGNEPVELGRTLHAKVGFLFYLSRFDELFECSRKARALFESVGDRQRLGRLDSNLAMAYHRLDRHLESLECSERALAVLRDAGDREGTFAATVNSAVTLSAMHEFDRAERYFGEALGLATELGMSDAILLCRCNLAYLWYLGGESEKALQEFAGLRRVCETNNDEKRLCICWIDEAEILLEIGDLNDCIDAARRGRTIGERLGLNFEVGKSLLFEAAARLRLGEEDDAAPLLDEAMHRFNADGNHVWTAVSKLQTALLRSEHGKPEALNEAESALSALKDSGLPHRIAMAEIATGRIQRTLGDLDNARRSFESALTRAAASRSGWMEFHASHELGLTLEAAGNPRSSDSLDRAERMLDKLWSRLGSDDLKMAFLGDRENVYTHLVPAVLSKSPETAFDLSEKARSRVLGERLIHGPKVRSVEGIQSRLGTDETIVEYFTSESDLCIFVVTADTFYSIRKSGAIDRLRQRCSDLERHIASCSVKWERLQSVRHQLESTARAHLQALYDELLKPVESSIRSSLLVIPHGFLHGVPFQALHDGLQFLSEKCTVAYSPSAALYCTPASPDMNGRPLLIAFSCREGVGAIEEIECAAEQLPGSEVLLNPPIDDLRQALTIPRKLIHIAGHAGIDLLGGKLSWIETPEGCLTSSDLTNMHIAARTVVITGCRTARRIIRPGDEWLGLMRAFYLAGAGAIVPAFWDVRDETARRFAAEFYRHFHGHSVSTAVQRACASLMMRQPHPYFWAGFAVFSRKTSLGEQA
jgi:CHAT domain-containing protein/tetratricopeptide (TPR) repeat protein